MSAQVFITGSNLSLADAGIAEFEFGGDEHVTSPNSANASPRNVLGTLWEREAEREVHTVYDLEGERFHRVVVPIIRGAWEREVRSNAPTSAEAIQIGRGPLVVMEADALWSCGYDDATGEPYSHDFAHGLTCLGCGETLTNVAYVGMITRG